MQTHQLFHRIFINSNIYSLLIIYTLLISVLFFKNIQILTVSQIVISLIAGLLAWTLNEYLIHRFLFHGERKNVLLKKFQFFMHGYHHSRPRDPDRLVLPFILTLPITISLYYLLAWMFPRYSNLLLAGYLMGYIWYDVTHYVIHRAQPRTKLGKFQRQYHYHHHFKDHANCFGVTSPMWDFIFGTRRAQKT